MVVLKLTKLTLESDFKACKIGPLWKAKKATKQEKERGGHPPLILALKIVFQPLKIHWISVARRPNKACNKGLGVGLKIGDNQAYKKAYDLKQKLNLKQT